MALWPSGRLLSIAGKSWAAMYGFDLEGERRREAEFRDEIRRRWEAGIDHD